MQEVESSNLSGPTIFLPIPPFDGGAARQQDRGRPSGGARALVGDQGFLALNHLNILLRVESFVRRDEGAELALADSPLTDAQLRAVSEAFLDFHTDQNPGYQTLADQPADPDSGLTPLDVAYLQRTAVILSPQQQGVVKTYRADQTAALRRIKAYQPKAVGKGADPSGTAPKL